ncbi:hypothetical protein [Actinomadura sp. 9N215]|uniref:hypothetical protein n=1 Tax=Actinomadura sp. 9N215 TaxID=3375150 RepID=UPI003795591E
MTTMIPPGTVDFYAAASAAIPVLLLTTVFQVRAMETYDVRARIRFLPASYVSKQVYVAALTVVVLSAMLAELTAFWALLYGPAPGAAVIVSGALIVNLAELTGRILAHIFMVAGLLRPAGDDSSAD